MAGTRKGVSGGGFHDGNAIMEVAAVAEEEDTMLEVGCGKK